MSFMPNVGVVVKLKDGRKAVVSSITPKGDDDRVRFQDGHEERVTAWDFAEAWEEEDEILGLIEDRLKALDNQERVNFLLLLGHIFCQHCGRWYTESDYRCQCWNDE